MNIVIFGAGGTGAAIGAYLAKAGEDVTFVARGEHLEAMKEKGLLIKRSLEGDILINPVKAVSSDEYEGTPDIVFVCVKYYGIEDAIKFLERVAKEHTLIVPILNVFGTGDVINKRLPKLTVLDGCMYIFAKILEPGVIDQPEKIFRIIYGYRKNQPRKLEEKAVKLEKILQDAGIRGHFSQNIERDALQKFAFISPMGAAGLYYNAVTDDFQKPGEVRDMFVGLIKEVVAVGNAMGITFERDLVETGLTMMDAFKKGLRSSMQRDVLSGRPSEFDGLVRRVVKLGKEYNVETPLYEKVAKWGDSKGL